MERMEVDVVLLYDELKRKLQAFNSPVRSQEKFGNFLTPLVERGLPKEILLT